MVYLNGFSWTGLFNTLARNFAEEGNTLMYWVITVLALLITSVIPYLLGSLNASIIFSRLKYGQDIRTFGSGNAGLTNMYRVYGKQGAALTLLGDILKQIVSVFIGVLIFGVNGAYIAGGFCMLGHIFPIFYKFKGGKGVLTAGTMILLIDPIVFAVIFTVFILVVLITRYISLGSIMAAFTYPAAVYNAAYLVNGTGPGMFEMFFSIFVGCVVIYMHRANIYRIFNNQESKFSFRKKPETQEILDMEDSENDKDKSFYPPAVGNKNKKRKK